MNLDTFIFENRGFSKNKIKTKMANIVDPDETLRPLSSGSTLFTMVYILVCRAEMVKTLQKTTEPGHSIPYKVECAPSEESDQRAYPNILSRTSVVRLKKAWMSGYPQRAKLWLWPACANAQADLSHCFADMGSFSKCCVPAQLKTLIGHISKHLFW